MGIPIKERFLKQVISPCNRSSRSLIKNSEHIRPIVYSVKKDDHFFERVLEREIDKGQLGSLFKNLMEKHIVELYYMFYKHGEEIKDRRSKGKENWFTICAHYKTVSVVFTVFNDEGDERDDAYKLMPLTVMPKARNRFTSDFSIDVREI